MGEIDLLGIGKFATAAKEPILKLMELCECAIGKIYEPTHVVRMAKAHAEEIKLISAVSRENTDVPILYSKGDIKIDSTSGEELAIRAQTRVQYQEVQKQQNIDSIVSNACIELEKEETVSKEPVDKDWATRLFNIAGEVSNEDLQLLWGKILSGEVKHPGSYSLRTLDRLSNLSKEEAEAFSNIANYVLKIQDRYFIYSDEDILNNQGLNLDVRILLDEVGLISLTGITTTMHFNKDHETQAIEYGNNLILIKRNNEQIKELKVPYYQLTRTGVEIYSIVNKCFKENYLNNVASKLKEQKVTVSYTKILDFKADGNLSYDRNACTLL